MSNVLDHATFEKAYSGKVPWDIGKPQGPFVAVADRVTGIDFVEEVIRRARGNAPSGAWRWSSWSRTH